MYNLFKQTKGIIMKKFLAIIGSIMLVIGAMSGESENLLIPFILIIVGGLLMKIGGVLDDDYGEYDEEL